MQSETENTWSNTSISSILQYDSYQLKDTPVINKLSEF